MAPQVDTGSSSALASDLLQGARAIGVFIYGEGKDERETETNTRKVYHLKDKYAAPIFMLGGVASARKSTLLKWVEEQEQAAVNRQPDGT